MKDYMTTRFDSVSDDHSRTWYTMGSLQWWQWIRVSLVGAGVVFATAIGVVVFRDWLSEGRTGLVLNFALLHTFYLTGLTLLACELEGTMASTERVLEYTALPQEIEETACDDTVEVPEDWPRAGWIEITGLKARYLPHLEPSLQIDRLVIPAATKVGVVGRTGSGKTTLVNCLFRMLVVDHGCITIDGLDIAAVGLRTLRSRLSLIPQHPMLFKGTLRENVDPFRLLHDDTVVDVIVRAGLHTVLKHTDNNSLLEHQVDTAGEGMSVGTRQLVCVARALAKQSKVVCLDESTASLDVETDALVMKAMKHHFQGATCLTIAHRLHTIISCDQIVVVDNGVVVEHDPPHVLMNKQPPGPFAKLVESTGLGTSQKLRQSASESHTSVTLVV
eukprot:TRINITY_DN44522_c0_g1_i2.p1 TRINITY_DN44522_c0_g1~~TRINITY_DN44522_c0_g1_i2.p1  ORF type:complete len:389 (+),score=73.82 TRINITY_DN44522_c0_g1_i2:96-1262(+)